MRFQRSIGLIASIAMHILVIGGTGPSGVAFINAALAAGHELTIYARSPRKLSWEILNNKAHVHVIEGTFEDSDAIRKAVTGGAEALVSCAGPVFSNRGKGTPVSDFYTKVYRLIQEEADCKIKRCLILSTGSYSSVRDSSSLRWTFIVFIISTFATFMYNEIVSSARTTAAQPVDKIGWTLFRVPILHNRAANAVQVGFKGDGKDGMALSRKSLAVWLVQELAAKEWIGEAPMLSDATWL